MTREATTMAIDTSLTDFKFSITNGTSTARPDFYTIETPEGSIKIKAEDMRSFIDMISKHVEYTTK